MEHLRVLECTKDRGKNVALAAGWATKEYAATLEEIAHTLIDPYVLDRLQLSTAYHSDDSTNDQQKDADRYFKLIVRMVATRAWSMSHYSICHPDKWAGSLHTDINTAKEAFFSVRDDAKLIGLAWQRMTQPDDATDRQACCYKLQNVVFRFGYLNQSG